jgi:predicted  nucleic acid-binding Zn-ribbon protein
VDMERTKDQQSIFGNASGGGIPSDDCEKGERARMTDSDFKTLNDMEALIRRLQYLKEQTTDTMPDHRRLDREIADLEYKIDHLEEIGRWKPKENE